MWLHYGIYLIFIITNTYRATHCLCCDYEKIIIFSSLSKSTISSLWIVFFCNIDAVRIFTHARKFIILLDYILHKLTLNADTYWPPYTCITLRYAQQNLINSYTNIYIIESRSSRYWYTLYALRLTTFSQTTRKQKNNKVLIEIPMIFN